MVDDNDDVVKDLDLEEKEIPIIDDIDDPIIEEDLDINGNKKRIDGEEEEEDLSDHRDMEEYIYGDLLDER